MARRNQLDRIKAAQLQENPEIYSPEGVATPGRQAGKTALMLEQMQAAMETDIQRLKTIDDVEGKAELKRELIEPYLPFVNDYMAKKADTPNSVAVRVMIWLMDIGDIEKALELGLYLIATGNQVMPAGFNSTMPTFLADYIYDWAHDQLKAEQSASPYLDQFAAELVSNDWDLHPAVAGKIMAMMAKHSNLKGNIRIAHQWCVRAEEANPKAGVKGLRKELEKRIKDMPTGVQEYIESKE